MHPEIKKNWNSVDARLPRCCTPLIRGIAAAAMLCVAASVTRAATITWNYSLIPDSSPADGVLDWSGNVSTNGTLVNAQNLGGSAGTFGGVNFAAGTVSFDNLFTGYYNPTPANDLAHTGTWSGNASTLVLDLATIGQDLGLGQEYEVQLFFADARAALEGRTVTVDGGPLTQYAYNGNDTGWPVLSALGTFTADATSQSITINTFNTNLTVAGGQLNGFQIRAVPEPAAALLAGIGLLALLRRRR